MQFAAKKAAFNPNTAELNEDNITDALTNLFVDEEALSLGQEDDEGSVEYKRKLVDPTPERKKHLTTQMKFRLNEGEGECMYQIGFDDDGDPIGISEEWMKKSLLTLDSIAKELKAITSVLRVRTGKSSPGSRTAEVLVRLKPTNTHGSIELRVAVVGNVDSGKSTLIGVLTKGGLDNGRGSARSHCFRHKHEIDSGRTSSVAHGCLGFGSNGDVTNYTLIEAGKTTNAIAKEAADGAIPPAARPRSMTDVLANSTKLVNFIDLAGHEKYLKTTVFGLTGNMPDYSMIMLGANMGVQRMTKEHLGITLALQLPVFVVITKVDIAPKRVRIDTIKRMKAILKSPGAGRKLPYMMKNEDDIVNCAKNMCRGGRLVPMLQISNVTGEGLDLLRLFLNLLPSKQEWKKAASASVEFCIDDSFQVTGVGTVVSGNMFKGTVDCSNSKQKVEMLIGPDEFGEFKPILIKSVHTRGIPVNMAQAGMSASFAIKANGNKTKKIERSMIRKGMVIVDPQTKPRAAYMFEAEVVILHHPTTIQPGYQPVVHMRTARQAAKVITISKPLLRSGDRATVTFRFSYRPEYIIEGVNIIFREGRTKGQGVITRIIFEDEMEAINAQTFAKQSP